MTEPTTTQYKDSESYLAKKKRFQNMLTIFGRKPVLEALQNKNTTVHRLHLAENNRPDGIIQAITKLAASKQIEVVLHSRDALSRISKNRKQDQGVAADIICPGHQTLDDFLAHPPKQFRLLAVDGVHNPQNLGMIIRTVAASPLNGLLLAAKGNAGIGPLTIKASSGAVFHCPILRCDDVTPALAKLSRYADICVLTGSGAEEIGNYQPQGSAVYVLGNETEGVSKAVLKLANYRLKIPMQNNVESLNVAVAAALIAFRTLI